MADGLDARVENLKVDDSGDKLYKKMYDDEIDGPLPIRRDLEEEDFRFEYNMKHKKRGLFVLINNKKFDPVTEMGERTGTDVDAANLDMLFRKLGFDVQTYKDRTCKQMKDIVKEAASYNHDDSDCFACAILSHGDEGIIYGKDGFIKINDIFAPFKGNVCPKLAGKPKFFIIQACRGNALDQGVDVSDAVGSTKKQRIPAEADFLYAYSTTPGYFSWRNSANGSWFIQAFIRVLNEFHAERDVLWMLTRVNRMVAYDFESNASQEFMNKKKQVPCIVSQLTKDFYLKPK